VLIIIDPTDYSLSSLGFQTFFIMTSNLLGKMMTHNNVSAYIVGSNQRKGIVLLSEWWGLNNQIKGLSDRFSQQGFFVVVPDLYHGKVATDANEANHLMSGLDFKAAVKEVEIWIDWLKSEKNIKKVGVTGFCMGGALSLASASALGNKVSAISVFYGVPDVGAFPLSTITAEVLLNFGDLDDMKGFSDQETVRTLCDGLKNNGKTYELITYSGAQHAFMNETSPRYSLESAKRGFSSTVDFFSRVLIE
jgi:carboxymethylenebutenolidase